MKCLLALLLIAPQLLCAEPVTVDAGRFDLIQGKHYADFFDHVVIKRDDMTLKADKVRVWYQEDDVTRTQVLRKVEASGHVFIDTPESKGIADYAMFTVGLNILVMKGKAQMTSKQGTVAGEHIEYNIKTKDTKVVGGKEGGQVRFTFDEKP